MVLHAEEWQLPVTLCMYLIKNDKNDITFNLACTSRSIPPSSSQHISCLKLPLSIESPFLNRQHTLHMLHRQHLLLPPRQQPRRLEHILDFPSIHRIRRQSIQILS